MEIREYTAFDCDEIVNLYNSVGWTAYTDDPASLEAGLKNSLLVLAAHEKDELLGLVRAVGDGHTVVLIQDILVFPEHQRRGIGTALINALLDRFEGVRQIQLVTDDTQKTLAFYKSLGFGDLDELCCRGFMWMGQKH